MLKLDAVRSLIREIPDFPKEGILFRDINPILRDAPAFATVLSHMAAPLREKALTRVVGIESRGFILGAALANVLEVGFSPIRKPGKLPGEVFSQNYSLEYGMDGLELQKDALRSGDRVVLVDDVLATGGTAEAGAQLCEMAGAQVEEMLFLLEIKALGGREHLAEKNIRSIFLI